MSNKCVKCGFESDDRFDFCGVSKVLDEIDLCRPCGGAPVNKDQEGKFLRYLSLGAGEKIATNEDRPRGCY